MKLSELKEKLVNTNIDTIFEFVEIKKFLPLATKAVIVDTILESCLEYDENGMLRCNYISKEVAYYLNLIKFYTDIVIDNENAVDDYDYLDEMGIFVAIRALVKDYDCVDYLLDKELEQRLSLENSLEGVVAKGINKLADKIPTDKQLKSLIKSVVKDLNKLDWNKVPMLKQMLDVAQGKEVDK